MITYEDRLEKDLRWALDEGSRHFMNESDVHKTMRRIAAKLDELGIAYALVGGMAMFLHGFRRFTEDVDLLVTEQGLSQIHDELNGLGYVQPFAGSKQLRDTSTGVRVEFLVAGQFPGDGKPKPVAFPDPQNVSVVIDEVRCVDLVRLVELKLASGSAPGRRKDLADVQELIRTLTLPKSFGDELNESVRAQFIELWAELQDAPNPHEQT